MKKSLLLALSSLLATSVASTTTPTITSAFFTPPHHRRQLHVRAVGDQNKFGAVPLPIRNARTAGANGQASVAGPCGGSNAYKAAGAPEVPVGSKVSLSLQYAAGHESPANKFTATFRCGAPTENQMTAGTQGTTTFTAAQCTTTQGGTEYPVPAPTGRDAKVVECTLPPKTAAELAGTGSQCTMSLQDQRDWGGCMDIKYVAAAAPGAGDGQGGQPGTPTPTAPEPPATAVKSTSLTNIVTSGPPPLLECCGLITHDVTATPGPKTAAGETTLILSGTASGNQCVAGLNYPQNTINLNLNNVQLNGKVGSLSFKKTLGAQVLIGGVPADIEYISNVLTFTMDGGAGNPKVCDTELVMGAGPPPPGTPPNTQTGNTGNQNTGNTGVNGNSNALAPSASPGLGETAVVFIVVTVLVVLGAIGLLMLIKKRKEAAAAASGGLPTAAVAVVVTTKSNANKGLKTGWSEAKDETGATYYYNKTTGETTWERHLVSA